MDLFENSTISFCHALFLLSSTAMMMEYLLTGSDIIALEQPGIHINTPS